MKLRYKLEGQPLPQVTWYFDEKEIEPGDRYTVISDFQEFIVMLPRPSVDMTGAYTAVARNQHGVNQTSTTLTVQGPFHRSVFCRATRARRMQGLDRAGSGRNLDPPPPIWDP